MKRLKNIVNRKQLLKRQFKLEDLPEKKGKKFVIIQIDGLSYPLLKTLSKTKYMPSMGKLLDRYNITKWDPGVPANTHFIQAGIMYGNNSIVPGFKFYDKKKGKVYALGTNPSAKAIEEELALKNKGILRGGTSINNVYSGGADRSVMTMAKIYENRGRVGTLNEAIKVVLLNPVSSLRIILLTAREICLELYESFLEIITSFVNQKHFNWPFFHPYFPFFRAFMTTTTREISTQTMLLEIERNVPYLYVNYLGYDSLAHYRGPTSISGFNLLKQIDRDIKKIVTKAEEKNYDVFIMSDHGQVPSKPFDKLYYETFDEFVAKVANTTTKSFIAQSNENTMSKFMWYKIKYYYKHFSLPLRIMSWSFVQMLRLSVKMMRKEEKELSRVQKQPIIIQYSSSLAQMYLNFKEKRLDISEIEEKYPTLVKEIVQHPGIGFIIGKEGDEYHIIHAKGKIILKKNSVEFKGERFLKVYGDEKKLVKQIRYFASLKYTGDLIIIGDYDGKTMVAFDHFHFGTHDSLGGEQQDSFFISKERIDLSHITNAKELYPFFEAYHDEK
jgi:hypothetical protein